VIRAEVRVYGVSLGGTLAMFLASRVPTVRAVVAGAPAPIWFLGAKLNSDGSRPDFDKMQFDPATVRENIAPIRMPVLIIVGSEDRLQPLAITLHDELARQGKAAHLEIFEHGYHDFVLGNQGQERKDLPRGEILLPGALEALELTVKFLKDPR
jgi:pimeloyl-ACP methyl ester carboxylesterase